MDKEEFNVNVQRTRMLTVLYVLRVKPGEDGFFVSISVKTLIEFDSLMPRESVSETWAAKQ